MERPPSAKNTSAQAALWSRLLGILFWGLVFGIAYTQAPLYYSNQHQYFLHGLAWARVGDLEQDWLARTADPTPVFSALVALTAGYLHVALFYVYYLVLLGTYFWSLVWLVDVLPGRRLSGLPRLVFFTLLIVLHAGLLRLASARLSGVDYPWYFQSGVAGQYVLGFGLQPSAFGVLFITSLAAFLNRRPCLAAVCTALAGIVHPTYLLPGGLLVLAYLVCLLREGQVQRAVLSGSLALVLVLPVVGYSWWEFGPSSQEQFAEAQRLIARVRIPHHTSVRQWCDGIAVAQLIWCLLAIGLVWRTRLFLLLFLPTLLATALTVVQVWTGNPSLALLFPWRFSALLVPVATAILLAWLCGALTTRAQAHGVWRGVCAAALVVAVLGGLLIEGEGLGYGTNRQELPLLADVRSRREAGQVYLLPVRIPPVWDGSGSVSTNFTVPPRPNNSKALIPVDLQGFRLETGTPIFVDFKAIPYKDVDVLEWYERMELVQRWYGCKDWNQYGMLDTLVHHKITHVVTTAQQDIRAEFLEEVYHDDFYRVYRLRKPSRK